MENKNILLLCYFQIQQYVKELNSLESRRGRKPLDVNNVVYWFKNARAAQKRAEVRGIIPGKVTNWFITFCVIFSDCCPITT